MGAIKAVLRKEGKAPKTVKRWTLADDAVIRKALDSGADTSSLEFDGRTAIDIADRVRRLRRFWGYATGRRSRTMDEGRR